MPAVLQDPTDPAARTAIWFEHDTGFEPRDSYFFVRFEGSPRVCSMVTDESELLYRPSSTGSSDAATGAPVVYGMPDARVMFNPYDGWINRYHVDSSGFPDPSAGLAYDMSPGGPGGGDVSLLVDPGLGVVFSPFKCQRDSGGGIAMGPCDGSGAVPWGRVQARELVDPSVLLDTLPLNDWVSSAPVRVANNTGPLEYTLIAFGTDESTNVDALGVSTPPESVSVFPYDTTYDCAFITATWDGASLDVAGYWSDEVEDPLATNTCCIETSPVDTANGFVGEPVPYGTDRVFALRHRAELMEFSIDLTTGAPTRSHTVVFDDGAPGAKFRVPAEHSAVVGYWPGAPASQRLFFAVNRSGAAALNQGYLVEIDPDAMPCPTSAPCTVDPAAYAVGVVPGATPFWGPPISVRLQRSNGGWGTQTALGVVAVTAAAQAAGAAPTSAACRAGDVPPTLRLWWRQSPVSGSWAAETLPLSADCFEWGRNAAGVLAWIPIEAVSGVVAGSSGLYVALSDGKFREYNSFVAQQVDSTEWRVTGYSGPWPRMRHDNHNTAARP